MRIAVIGTGISGNLVARLLCAEHDVDVFEANDYIGGHTNTVDVEIGGNTYSVDTGFMVFNERTYPNFCRMLELLGLSPQDSDMSFSVRCEKTGLEYKGGGSLNELFAQRRNILRPGFYRMLRDILRFYRDAPKLLAKADTDMTLGQYLEQHRYSREFIDQHLVPMVAAIWSSHPQTTLDFPALFLIRFFRNHGLLQLRDQPRWKTVSGGARAYVEELTRPFRHQIRLNCAVESVSRHADQVVVRARGEMPEFFDHVIFATHADQTLKILEDANDREHEILAAFAYQRNDAILHTDSALLPNRRRAWASWNYHVPSQPRDSVAVTYELCRLQNIKSPKPILLTLNHGRRVDPTKILRRFTYHHPSFTIDSLDAQRKHVEISGRRRTHFCGAYWGNGFHEDGVNSALAVANYFGKTLESCKVASTTDESSISVSVP